MSEGAGSVADPIWLDLTNPTRAEEKVVEDLLGISLPTRGEMQEIEVSARLYQENGAEFMTVSVVGAAETDEPSLTPVTFVLKGKTLVTVRFTEDVFSTFVARSQKANEVACCTGEQVMLGLL